MAFSTRSTILRHTSVRCANGLVALLFHVGEVSHGMQNLIAFDFLQQLEDKEECSDRRFVKTDFISTSNDSIGQTDSQCRAEGVTSRAETVDDSIEIN